MQRILALSMVFCLFVLLTPSYAGLFDNLMNKAKQATEDVVTETIKKSPQTDTPPQSEPAPVDKQPAHSASPKALPAPAEQSSQGGQNETPGSTPGLVRAVQARLNQLGYDAGPEDGMYGPGTREAIESFQADQGYTVTGKPSESLLIRLKTASQSQVIKGKTGTPDTQAKISPATQSTQRLPANEASLALLRLRHDPSWLDDEERLYNLTRRQIQREQMQGSQGLRVFDPESIAGREPEFAAHELAPDMRRGLLEIATRVGTGFYQELNWNHTQYDFSSQTVSYTGRTLRPAPEKVRAGLPPRIKNRALYEIPRGPSFSKIKTYGIFAQIEPAAELLAFDRSLNIDNLPLSPKLAEKVSALDTRVIRLLFRITGAVEGVLLATLEGLEVSPGPDAAPLLAYGPEHFPLALSENALTTGPPPSVERNLTAVMISPAEPDMADLLLLRHFPERLDDAYLLVLMQERQRFEKSLSDPPWGRFFNPKGRDVDPADLATHGQAFREWTLARAARLTDLVVIRVERQRVGYNPASQRANLSFSSSSSCLEQGNVSSSGAQLGIRVKSTRDECGEQRYQWKRQPEVLIALDKNPLPPPPEIAAELAAKRLPMEIAVRITGKQAADSSSRDDQLSAKLLEVRYFNPQDHLVATVKPSVPTKAKTFDPLMRAHIGSAFGPDVIGIRLGMNLQAADAAARDHDPVKDRIQGKAPFPFDGAYAYVFDDGSEFISLFTIADDSGEKIVALERQVYYLPSTAPADEAVLKALHGKYGEPTKHREGQGFTSRWSHDAEGSLLKRQTAASSGCETLLDSPRTHDVFQDDQGNPYVWALPGLDRVWMGPGNGFGLKRDGTTAEDMALCGPEMVATWSHNNGQLFGPSLRIALYDGPWIHAMAEVKRAASATNLEL